MTERISADCHRGHADLTLTKELTMRIDYRKMFPAGMRAMAAGSA